MFRDIDIRWEYMNFIKQAREEKPYRGMPMPKYPLGKREYSDRYWVPVISEDDKKDWISKSPPIKAYYGNSLLGIYHPDNTFEFKADTYYCVRDTMIMSRLLPGWVSFRINYGGMMFHHKQSRVTHPVHKGMRIRLCDGTPTKNYEVHVNCVDRKLTAPLRKQYDEFFKIAGAMLRTMGDEAIYKELHEIETMVRSGSKNLLSDVININDPAGSVMALALRYDWANTRSRLHWNNNNWSYKIFCNHSRGGENLVKSIKELFFTELYKKGLDEGEQYLMTKIVGVGEKMPTCYWGHKMFVDGVEVQRVR